MLQQQHSALFIEDNSTSCDTETRLSEANGEAPHFERRVTPNFTDQHLQHAAYSLQGIVCAPPAAKAGAFAARFIALRIAEPVYSRMSAEIAKTLFLTMPANEEEINATASEAPLTASPATRGWQPGDAPKKLDGGRTVCDERNAKGKLCNGHLKQLRTGGQDSKEHLRGQDVLYKCQTCGTLYSGPPLGHLRDSRKQSRFVQQELISILQAAGGTLPFFGPRPATAAPVASDSSPAADAHRPAAEAQAATGQASAAPLSPAAATASPVAGPERADDLAPEAGNQSS